MATPRKDPKDRLQTGRPSKFNPSTSETICETVIDCMNKGYIVEEVCAEIGIARDTFFKWVKEYPEFSDAYKKGKSAFTAFWTRAYKKVMMGIPLNPPKKTKPKPKPGEKPKPGQKKEDEKEEEAVELGKANPAMMIFYMKAHCGWRETVNNNNKVKLTTTNSREIPADPKERRALAESLKRDIGIGQTVKPKQSHKTEKIKENNA
jgi:transposase-like protein